MGKLLWRNLSQTFESGDFRIRTEVSDGLLALLIAVAIMRDEVALLLLRSQLGISISHHLLVLNLGALVAYTEQWGLQHVYMSLLDKVGEELEEEGDDEQSDVHTIHIGIGGYNHLVVTQAVQAILYVEGCLEQVELLVLIYHLLGQAKAIQWLTTQREHRLGIHIAALGDASAGRIALGDEDGRFLLALILGIAEVDAAVTQLTVVEVCLLALSRANLVTPAIALRSRSLSLILFSNISATSVWMWR